MNQQYLNQLEEMTRHMQRPLQELINLNLQTWKELKLLKSDEITQFKKPEELWEKQVSMVIENGHLAINYLRESLELFNRLLLSLSQDSQQTAKSVLKTARSSIKGTESILSSQLSMMEFVRPMLDPLVIEPPKIALEIANMSMAPKKPRKAKK